MQGKRQRCHALLVSEPTNPHDGNAIRVEILGNRVGYLPRQLAANFNDWLRMNGYGTIEASCDAMIVGGWELSEFDTFDAAEEGQFGVRLDIGPLGSAGVPECTESQFTFAPMLQGRITDNVLESGYEAFHLQIGDPVTLWQSDSDPSLISIFARGSMAGVGRIGYVPPQYYKVLCDQMRAGLPIESQISHIQDGRCFIRFRLVSSKEVELLRQVKLEGIRAELTKPYSPRKPIRAVVIRLNASTPFLKLSDQLLIARKPTIEEFLDGDREPNLLFECVGSSGIYHCDDDKVKKGHSTWSID